MHEDTLFSILFLDDRYVAETKHLFPVLGAVEKVGPVIKPDTPLEKDVVSAFGSCLWDEDKGAFTFYYQLGVAISEPRLSIL